MGAEPVDVVLALDANAGVLDAGDELDELVVVFADVAARVGGRDIDIGLPERLRIPWHGLLSTDYFAFRALRQTVLVVI